MEKFYDCKTDSQIKRDDFIKIYNGSYFLSGERMVKGVIRNSTVAENEIERILNEGIKTDKDVINILAWKLGKIKHRETDAEKNGNIVFSKDWKNAYKLDILRYGRQWENIKEFVDYIVRNINDLRSKSKCCPQKVLNELKDQAPKGIGTVYLITLLYFISQGKYPIYDRFAYIALQGIKHGTEPFTKKIKPPILPDKNSEKFKSVYEDYIEPYIKELSDIFGSDYNRSVEEYRNIDRALWVYGHAFK